jgi:signal transduction histidine kinase/CheY-like chemotaxis protein
MRRFASSDSRKVQRIGFTDLSIGAGARPPESDSRTQDVLATLLESLECGVLLSGTGGDLWAINDRFAEILRVEPERLRELSNLEQLVERIAPQFTHGQSVAARWRERFRSGEAFWDELELEKPEKKTIERYARPILDRYKNPLGWLEVYRDITSRRQVESRLFHNERLAALGQMVSGVAHELNNVLTSIFGYAQLVEKRARGFEWESEARHIWQETERAKRIAQNLLLFARGSKGERTRVNLNGIVARTAEIRAYELRLGNISVEVDRDEKLPDAIADPTQIQQALLNLILNAEQAIRQTKQSGHIWIRTRRISATRLTLEVADDGPGVPPEVVLQIFDPFFTTKPAGVGTGLGLSILYGIVHEHGGEVSVGTRPGGGAVFTVELPSANSSSSEVRPYLIPSAGLQEPVAEHNARGSRILVVEDEPTVAQLIADVLSEEGHFVDTVLDSRDGLDLARTHAYDLIICDLRMPHLDGRDFYRQLTTEESPLERKLIFVTGDTVAPRTIDFLQKCGLPYVAKPFLVEELKSAVARGLGGTNGLPSNSVGPTERKAPTGREHSHGRHLKRYES